MANVDFPHGLRPLNRTLAGGVPRVQKMSKDAAEGTAIFIWDAVNREADGNLDAASATPGTTLYSGVNLGPFGAASTLTDHLINISPDAVFEAQDNNATDGFAAADMGLNANLQLNAPAIPGPATAGFTGISGHEINETGADVTATLDVHLLSLLNAPDNAFGAFSRIEIIFNKHRMAPAAVGV